MNPIICIAGPTASGKTALAVALAKELNAEVVCTIGHKIVLYRRSLKDGVKHIEF